MRFRPCIDLHLGLVKQLVGSSLGEAGPAKVNFQSERSASDFARIYREDGLDGGHVIMLGAGNEEAASAAVAEFPNGLHVGGGIRPENASRWLDMGASAVIVTSFLFRDGKLDRSNLEKMVEAVGRQHLVIDLSCTRDEGNRYVVATDRWQNRTDFAIDQPNLEELSSCCSEYLIHATQREGMQQGIDDELVRLLGDITPIPTTYAGGISSIDDVETVGRLGQNRLDYTVGSALDLFGGEGVHYRDLLAYHRDQNPTN